MKEKKGPWQLGGLGVGELAKRTWKEIAKDDGFDAAAALGYYFMLALFPLLIFLISILATFSSVDLINSFMGTMSRVMPEDAYKLIGGEIARILKTPGGGLLTLGALGTLWAASSGVSSVLDGLNRAYEVEETRSFIKRRLLAIGLTISLAVLIILGSVMLVMSDKISEWIAQLTGEGSLAIVGVILNSVFGLLFMFLGLELLYYYGPNVKGQKWNWVSPGSLVSIILFIIASIGFSMYVRYGGDYSATYGSLGAIIILMLWLNLLGLAIIVGGEINSEIAKAALAMGNTSAPKIAAEKDTNAKSPYTEDSRERVRAAVNSFGTSGSNSPTRKLLPQYSSASLGPEAVSDGWMYEDGPNYNEKLLYKNVVERTQSKLNNDSLQIRRAKALRRLAEIEARNSATQHPTRMERKLWHPLGTIAYLISVAALALSAISKASAEPEQ